MFVLLIASCGQQPAATSALSPETNGPAGTGSPEPSGEDAAVLLAELTRAVRKYGFERQRVPASLDELVPSGHLPALPVAPVGKRFVIDPKTLQVGLK
jgi:hypothetical protein